MQGALEGRRLDESSLDFEAVEDLSEADRWQQEERVEVCYLVPVGDITSKGEKV